MAKEEQVKLLLDAEEYRLVVGALNEKRNDLIDDSQPTDEIDDIIQKAAQSPVRRVRVKER